MSFEQTLAVSLCAMLIGGAATLGWYDRTAFNRVAPIAALSAVLLLMFCAGVDLAYRAGALNQFRSDYSVANKRWTERGIATYAAATNVIRAADIPEKDRDALIAVTKADSIDLELPSDTLIPIWVCELLAIVALALFGLGFVFQFVRHRPRTNSE